MARFDVYANPDVEERKAVPYFLDVQSDFIVGLETRVVVPLWRIGLLPKRAQNLNPTFQIADQTVVMDTPAIGAVPVISLRRPIVNLAHEQLAIQDALDVLFRGY